MKTAILLSGGVDSAVLLAREVSEGRRPTCYTFAYGQRHVREAESARVIARHYGCRQDIIALPESTLWGSALTGHGDVPKAHYEDPIQAATVVPNRNAVLLSIAAARASVDEIDSILFAAHAGDAAIYPDCRKEFVTYISAALRAGCGIYVQTPFIAMSKRDIVALGRELDAPLHLTWSCYEGGDLPCGQCGACVERREAGA